ncbi:MAG: tetratricopeptide repeat protein [Acidobacteria bacterium]|nr:tetratricopeptide repeat protein [Acidobacteriota bacterium]
MTPERWRQLESLFLEATALPPAERIGFAARRCAADPVLGEELARLIRAEARPPEYLESIVRDGAATMTIALAASRLGSRVGPYRLTEILGEGGTGTVFLGRRDDAQYEAVVAIKLLHSGISHRVLLDRLKAERQILAQLDHPNIARLYDGGTTDDGEPYLVMEHVNGIPLLEFCERGALRGRARLGLFLVVCGAVEHAHRHLIVHRDLKPGNILVTPEGVPKLVDFGVAKLLEEARPGAAAAERTLAPLRMLTPSYASPEQIRGDPVTTASDVYSLGVLLYEMLTGSKPYAIDPAMPLAEIERRICSLEPPRPSAATRSAASGRWLRGDLDTIVLKALRKDASRRYATVAELREDIERFLTGHPVKARPEKLAYVAGKFVSRHRAGTALGLLAMIAITASAILAWVSAARARDERDRASRIASMLVGMFEIAEPGHGSELTVRRLLDHAAKQVETLSGQPETQASLTQTLAGLYEKSGDFKEAADLYAKVLALHEERGADPSTIAASLHQLARAVARGGGYARAAALFGRSLEIRRAIRGGRTPEVASTLNARALALHELGRFDEAETLYRESLALDTELLGAGHEHTMLVRGNLALLLHDTGKPVEAESLYRAILASIESSASGGGDEQEAEMRDGLGLALFAQGRFEEAAGAALQALEIRRKLYGAEHYLVARSMSHLGVALVRRGRLAEAEALVAPAADQRRRLLGERHMEYAESLVAEGLLLAAEGRPLASIDLLDRAVEIYRVALGPRHPLVAETLVELGRSQRTAGREDTACQSFAAAREIYSERDPRAAQAGIELASCR